MQRAGIILQAQLVTDKTVYTIGEYITYNLSGLPANYPYYFGLGQLDGVIPWGFGNSVTDANGNDALAFQVGENVPPGDWLLWIWDDLMVNVLSTPVRIEAAPGAGVPQLALILIPAVSALLIVGAIVLRRK